MKLQLLLVNAAELTKDFCQVKVTVESGIGSVFYMIVFFILSLDV